MKGRRDYSAATCGRHRRVKGHQVEAALPRLVHCHQGHCPIRNAVSPQADIATVWRITTLLLGPGVVSQAVTTCDRTAIAERKAIGRVTRDESHALMPLAYMIHPLRIAQPTLNH